MSSTPIEGGCLCGAVRFRADGPPAKVGYCHCRMCQRADGAPVVAWATFKAQELTWSGTGRRIFPSSSIAERGFCSICGTPMTWQSLADRKWIDVASASLDEPGRFAPADHIWTESQIPWFDTKDHLPRHAQRSVKAG